MKNGRSHSHVTALLVAVLAIMAFIRGPEQIWFLAAAFVMWGLWAMIPMVLKAQRRSNYQKQKRKTPPSIDKPREFQFPELDEPTESILLRHVNFRISAYLKSAFPDVTWEWQEKEPEHIIKNGGTARIRIFGVPDYNYASVVFDSKANIGCDVMKIVPLSEAVGATSEVPAASTPQPQPTDPQIWYELQGRQVLENLIADLHSRGHSSLNIKENGDICIKQADSEVATQTLKNFPTRNYWQALAKVFEKEGLAAAVTETGLAVTW
ncbi:hypothetical protein [Anaerotignum sp.]|uniref:hypothetical protein n=1 Tax=Anaerotignum sp. TaxID=2039241 RepID=UPI0028AB6B0F|nr:hypothetical protein [Anaerotignum sp.]